MNTKALEKAFAAEKGLTKDQKIFQDRVKAIKILQSDLQTLENEIEVSKSELIKNILPLEKQHIALLTERLKILEEAYLSLKLSKHLKNELKEIIINECIALLSLEFDNGVKETFDRFNDRSYQNILERDRSADDFYHFMDSLSDNDPDLHEDQPERKKTKKQMERENKQKEKEEAQKRTFKDIFRDLIKVFHPDKERDETKKLEKEELTKKITKAYKNHDLLSLLEMELMLLETNNERISQLAADKLKIYNEILLSQKQQVEHELYMVKSENEYVYRKMCYKNADKGKFITQMKNEWKHKIKSLNAENRNLKNKDFLKLFIEIYQEERE